MDEQVEALREAARLGWLLPPVPAPGRRNPGRARGGARGAPAARVLTSCRGGARGAGGAVDDG